MLQRALAAHVVDMPERRILQRVEKNDLALHILHETKKDIRPLALTRQRSLLAKKLLQDLLRALLSQIPFLANRQQQGQKNPRLLDPVKRKRREQTIVKLELDPDQVLELRQPLGWLIIH